jgi:hypothetical protein
MRMLPSSASISRERGSMTGKIDDEIALEEETMTTIMITITGMSAVVEDKMMTMRTGTDDKGEMIDDDEMMIPTEVITEEESIT